MKNYPEDFKTHVIRILKDCLAITNHSEYALKIEWNLNNECDNTEDQALQASIFIDHVYLFVKVSVYPELLYAWKNKDYYHIADTLLHEVCHLFIEPVWKLFSWDICVSQKRQYTEVLERQTQRITNAILEISGDEWFLPE